MKWTTPHALRTSSIGLSAIALASVMAAAMATAGAGAGDRATVVLDERTAWRTFVTFGPVLEGEGQDLEPVGRDRALFEHSPGPGADWTMVDFDDSAWARQRLPLYSGRGDDGHGFREERTVAMLATRGAFMIEQPRLAGALTLDLRYRGGVVVYLNGEEVAREHMPEGDLEPMTPAEQYPRETYLTPGGGRIPPPHERGNGGSEVKSRLQDRIRSATVELPADKLQRGRNVVAIAVYRAPSYPEMPGYAGGRAHWSKVALLEAKLRSDGGRGVEANVGPRQQVQHWNADPMTVIRPETGYADPGAELRPIRMIAPRNGTASGQVIVSRADGFGEADVRAAASPLRHVDGRGGLDNPAVHFAHMPQRSDGRKTGYFDIFRDRPQDDVPAQPVWVTVDVPGDAQPGRYRGLLRIGTRYSGAVDVPIELTVAEWRAPDVDEHVSHLALMQSPDTIARRYGVPLYSDEHFELMEPSMRLLGKARSQVMYITAIRRTHFGNDHAMIRFRDNGRGEIEPDFSAFDRYLELWTGHVGPPRIICLKVWGPGRAGDQVRLTKIDGRGELIEWTHDDFGTGDSRRLWEPVIEGLRQRIADRGWPEETLMLGVGADQRPPSRTVEFFQELAPQAEWALFTHGRGDPRPRNGEHVIRGMAVGYKTYPNNPRSRFPLRNGLIGGWNNPFLRTTSMRGHILTYSPPAAWRTLADTSVRGNFRGLARVGLDYWPLDGSASGGRGTGLMARFGTNNVLDINLMRENPRSIVAPGPHGAVPTVRFQMLREGRQLAEARIRIEQALADSAGRDRLGEDLEVRCRELLDAHLARLLLGERDWNWLVASPWRGHELAVYELAAEVEAALASE